MRSAILLSCFFASLAYASPTPNSILGPSAEEKPTPGHAILYRNMTSIPGLNNSICTHKLAEGQNVRYDDSGDEPCTNVPFVQPNNGRGYFDSAYAIKLTELGDPGYPTECSAFLYPEINCKGKITYVQDNVGACQEIPETKSIQVVCD